MLVTEFDLIYQQLLAAGSVIPFMPYGSPQQIAW
jgi:hypothetical protein